MPAEKVAKALAIAIRGVEKRLLAQPFIPLLVRSPEVGDHESLFLAERVDSPVPVHRREVRRVGGLGTGRRQFHRRGVAGRVGVGPPLDQR
jgi:hypothetical protein